VVGKPTTILALREALYRCKQQIATLMCEKSDHRRLLFHYCNIPQSAEQTIQIKTLSNQLVME